MSKLTQSARDEHCTIRVPGVCNHNPETTVLAHLSGIRYRHGVGRKVADIFGAFACSACHDCVDGRVRSRYTKDQLRLMHLEGVIETQMLLMDKGLL